MTSRQCATWRLTSSGSPQGLLGVQSQSCAPAPLKRQELDKITKCLRKPGDGWVETISKLSPSTLNHEAVRVKAVRVLWGSAPLPRSARNNEETDTHPLVTMAYFWSWRTISISLPWRPSCIPREMGRPHRTHVSMGIRSTATTEMSSKVNYYYFTAPQCPAPVGWIP